MFYLNIQRMMRLRGIEKHYRKMIELGFVPQTARALLRSDVGAIKLEHLARLCAALNCTPNDLLEWRPKPGKALAKTHSLNALARRDESDLPQLLSELPTDKFDKILEVLQELKETRD